jgi:hypothetical protein
MAALTRAFVRPGAAPAFGDVPPRGADPAAPSDALLTDFALPPLTETARELAPRSVSAGRQQVLTGAGASEGGMERECGRSTAVVHIAAHALVDERPGRGAAILLAPDEREDGLLHPDEIVADRHPATLTILAACHSAADVLENGRALGSLTGAFLAAGSKAVIATLWDVDDTTTARVHGAALLRNRTGFLAAERPASGQGAPERRSALEQSVLVVGYVLIGDAQTPLVPALR